MLDKNLNTIISIDFETTEESPFNVRVNSDDQISIYDVIEHITKQARRNCIRTWLDYKKANPELTQIGSFRFKGRGQNDTPVADWELILKIILNLPGKRAGAFRNKCAKSLAKHLMPKSWSVEKKVKNLSEFFNNLPPELNSSNNNPEELVVIELQREWGGRREAECGVGFIDLLTSDKIVEVKQINNWKHAIGQVNCYGMYFPNHQKTIVLFGEGCIDKKIIEQTCMFQNIKIWYK